MRTLIILNGELQSASFLKETASKFDYIICADGGYENAKIAGIEPDLVVGDFDSSKAEDYTGEKLVFPTQKDETDGELAIREAFSRGSKEVILTCSTGGRIDHFLANVNLLTKFNNLRILELNQEITYKTKSFQIVDKVDKTISIIPFENSIISLNGFKYEVANAEFKKGSTLGMSNVVLDSKAEVNIKSGGVFFIINN